MDPENAGYLTQKEVGFIAEILTLDALNSGKNVLVDGSLRNAPFYLQYIKDMKKRYPVLKIAILHVTAQPDTVLERCAKRAETTGRIVPTEVIMETMEQIPNSLRVLAPHVDFMATFENEGDEPVMLWSSRKYKPSHNYSQLKFFDESHEGSEESEEGGGSSLQHHRVWYTIDNAGHAVTPTPSRQRTLSTGTCVCLCLCVCVCVCHSAARPPPPPHYAH